MEQRPFNQISYNGPKQKIFSFGEMQYQNIVEWLFRIGAIMIIVNQIGNLYVMIEPVLYTSGVMLRGSQIFFYIIYLIIKIAILYIICQGLYFVFHAMDVWCKKNQAQFETIKKNNK